MTRKNKNSWINNDSRFLSECLRNLGTAFFTLMLVTSSCQRGEFSEVERSWIRDPENGILKTETRNGITVALTYIPKDFVIEFRTKDLGYDPDARLREQTSIRGLEFFLFSFTPEMAIDQRCCGEFWPGAKEEDIELLLGNEKTNPLMITLTSRTHGLGLTDQIGILIIFEADLLKREKDFTLKLNDVAYGTGLHIFKFNIDDLKKIPPLVFPDLPLNSNGADTLPTAGHPKNNTGGRITLT